MSTASGRGILYVIVWEWSGVKSYIMYLHVQDFKGLCMLYRSGEVCIMRCLEEHNLIIRLVSNRLISSDDYRCENLNLTVIITLQINLLFQIMTFIKQSHSYK